MDEVQYEVSGEGYDTPDTPHMMIMLDALEDTGNQAIDGTEGFTLTQAQQYAQGVLLAAGIVSYRDVSGNEGLFSSIGNAFASAWKYIKETFQSIWNFFFSRDAEKIADAAEEKVEKDNETAEKIAKGTGTEEEAKAAANKLASVAEKKGEGEVAKKLKEAKSRSEVWKEIGEALKILAPMDEKEKAALKSGMEATLKAKNAFEHIFNEEANKKIDNLDSVEGIKDIKKAVVDMGLGVKSFIAKDKDYIKSIEELDRIKTVDGMLIFGRKTLANIKDIKALSKTCKNVKGTIQSVLNSMESKLKQAKDNKDKDALSKSIGALKELMTLGTRIAKLVEANLKNVTNLNYLVISRLLPLKDGKLVL